MNYRRKGLIGIGRQVVSGHIRTEVVVVVVVVIVVIVVAVVAVVAREWPIHPPTRNCAGRDRFERKPSALALAA